MPAKFRGDISWGSQDLQDWAKEFCKKEKGGVSGHIQRHFERLRQRSQKKQ